MSDARVKLCIDKLANPARRALVGADGAQLADLASGAEREIAILHGMGPKGIRLLRMAITDHCLALATVRLDSAAAR